MTDTVPHQALYRRWRAQTFAQIVGQEAVVETLRNAVRTGRVAHAVLFVGPRGTGKTSLARILAKAINCTDIQDGDPCDRCPSCVAIREGRALDLVEIDAASNRGIDAIRELRERINYAPTDLRRKVYILDEAHQITRDAWNALLKSLEEPPDFVVFMFASTHPQDFPPAILSRLQRFDVRRLTVDEIEGKLGRILEADARGAEPGAIRLIATLAAGGMRDAESMLDQLLSTAGGRLDEATVRDLLGLADSDTVDQFVAALVAGDLVAGVRLLDGLESRGRDIRALMDQAIEVLRRALIDRALAGDGVGRSALAGAATRLAAIDPNRAGAGGLRLQVELALLAPGSAPAPSLVSPSVESAASSRVVPGGDGQPPRLVSPTSGPDPVARTAPPAMAEAPERGPTAAEHGSPPVATDLAPSRRSRSGARGSPEPAGTAPGGTDLPVGADAPVVPLPLRSAPDPTPVASTVGHVVDAAVSPDLRRLRDLWPTIVEQLSVHPPTKPLITACQPIGVEGSIVTLGFPEDKAFLRDVAERRRPLLEEGIGRAMGRAVAVRCIATNIDLVTATPADPADDFLLREARRIFAEELVDVPEVS